MSIPRRPSDVINPVVIHRVDKKAAIEEAVRLIDIHTTVIVTYIKPRFGKPYYLITTKG